MKIMTNFQYKALAIAFHNLKEENRKLKEENELLKNIVRNSNEFQNFLKIDFPNSQRKDNKSNSWEF